MSAPIPVKSLERCEWCKRRMEPSRAWKRFCGLNCKRHFEKAAREIGTEILTRKIKLEAVPINSKTSEYLNRN